MVFEASAFKFASSVLRATNDPVFVIFGVIA